MPVEYTLSLNDPHAHEFELSLRVACEPGEVCLDLPAWIPGSYMIRDFARNIRDLVAVSNGRLVKVAKQDKQTWQLQHEGGELLVSYRVYALDESVRSAYFDDTRAYFNGTSLFLRVQGHEARAHRLVMPRPAFPAGQGWRVATTLPARSIDDAGFGSYEAPSYQVLIDYPVETGDFQTLEFVLADIPHKMVFVDAEGADLDRIRRDLMPICSEHVAMFGELPVSRYLFQTLATRDGYGGLEHRDSTSLICKRSDLPWPGSGETDKGYRQYLALCSHEYFHLWNVKRIRPQRFVEADLSREVHSELLWAFEGITSYYDELALPRSGALSQSDYLDMLAPSLTCYYRNAGRRRQSVAESSFDAWTKFYKQDESAQNAIVSYYNKGALVALGLDRLIRLLSEDRYCLDDLMRQLWQRYGKTGRGIPERGIENEVEALTGQPLNEFFERYIYGVEELPLEDWLGAFGVGLRLRSAGTPQDQGGYVDRPKTVHAVKPCLGAQTSARDGLVRVDRVLTDSAAEQVGLTPGDLLVAVEGERCTQDALEQLLARFPVGRTVELTIFRRDRLRRVELPIQAAPADTVDLYWLDPSHLPEDVLARRERWLSSSARSVHD